MLSLPLFCGDSRLVLNVWDNEATSRKREEVLPFVLDIHR